MPAAAGDALATGAIALTDIEKILAPIRPATPVEFHYEWASAPGMVMMAMPQGTADQATPWVSQINSLLPADHALSPLETDFAFCARDERQEAYWPIATSPSYTPLSIPLGDAGIVLEIDRIRGQLADLTILPEGLDGGTPTRVLPNGDVASFNVNLQLQSVHADARVRNPPWPFSNPSNITIDITSIQATCVATITPAPVSPLPPGMVICGDQVFACTPNMTTLTVNGLTTTGLVGIPEFVWFFNENELEGFGALLLQVGVQLHFNNWAVTSLGALPGTSQFILRGTNTLLSDGTSACSPSTPPAPPEPPTRGLITTRTRRGHGELYSNDGWVKPFYVEAELSSDFHSNSATLPLVSRRQLPVALENTFDHLGREFPPIREFDVSVAQTRLNANIRQLDCWRKEARVENVIAVPFPKFGVWRGQTLQAEELGEQRARRIHLVTVEPADAQEVKARLRSIGQQCDRCDGWTRVRADIMDWDDRPFGPPDTFPDLPLEPVPWSFDVFVDANPDALDPWLNPFQKCAEEGGEKWRVVEGRRIYSMPLVELHDMMFDSARRPSGEYVEVGVGGAHAAWSIEGRNVAGNRTYKTVLLLEACLGQSKACWESTLKPPDYGFIWVHAGTSNTTIPRRALTAAMSSGTIPAYGSRNVAVQGYFDRSRVELVTAIPQIYVDNGVSAAGFDYRGGSMLDWRHDSAFLEPDAFRGDAVFRHVDGNFHDWLNPHTSTGGQRIAYRADWTTDVMRVRRGTSAGLSYCALPEQLSVDVDTVGFSGAGLQTDKLVPANVVFPSATSPVPVVNTNWRWGWTSPALSP